MAVQAKEPIREAEIRASEIAVLFVDLDVDVVLNPLIQSLQIPRPYPQSAFGFSPRFSS